MHGKIQVVFAAAAFCALAQDAETVATALSNNGVPMKLSFVCDEQDLAGAGMSCSDDNPCPVYLELNGVSSTGKKLALVGDVHGTSSTLYSVLLSSNDSGMTWTEATKSRLSGAALDQVQFLDAQHGWAAGEMQVPLARDAFFLITEDGGASWRRKPVVEDGIPGGMQRFWFDSAEHGELIVDGGRSAEGGRYSLYESHTGGDSWSVVSKTAQTPRLRTAPAVENVDYRIATDSASHTFVIEKRDGEKWDRMASFLVQVANCGSPSPPPPPPPDPPMPAEPPADGK